MQWLGSVQTLNLRLWLMRSLAITEYSAFHAVSLHRLLSTSLFSGQSPHPLHPTISVKPREGRALAQVTQGVSEPRLCPGPHPGLQTPRSVPSSGGSAHRRGAERPPEGGSWASFPCYRHWWGTSVQGILPTPSPEAPAGSSQVPKGCFSSGNPCLAREDSVVAKQGKLCYCHSTSRGRWLHCSQPQPEL